MFAAKTTFLPAFPACLPEHLGASPQSSDPWNCWVYTAHRLVCPPVRSKHPSSPPGPRGTGILPLLGLWPGPGSVSRGGEEEGGASPSVPQGSLRTRVRTGRQGCVLALSPRGRGRAGPLWGWGPRGPLCAGTGLWAVGSQSGGLSL